MRPTYVIPFVFPLIKIKDKFDNNYCFISVCSECIVGRFECINKCCKGILKK